MAKEKLTPKESLFIKEYLVDLNGVQACQRAGYKGTYGALRVTATNLLKKPRIAEAVQKEMDKRQKRIEIKADTILERLDTIGGVDIAKAFDERGYLLSIHDIPKDVRQCIKSIDVFEEFEGHGKDRIQVGVVRRIQFWDKLKANELLGKHKVLFTDKLEVTGSVEVAERIKKARQRVKK